MEVGTDRGLFYWYTYYMIIEVDEYKNRVEGYNASRSEDFHEESGKLADKDFIDCLKSKKYKRIILMAGGTASGKTEFARLYLNSKDMLVYDGTLKKFNGFKVKTDRIKKYCKRKSSVKIILIIPYSWEKAFDAFLGRERKMNINTFFSTQTQSKRTVARILMETKVRVEIFVSLVKEGEGSLSFLKIKDTRLKKAKLLEKLADNIEKISVDKGFEINQ